MPSHDARSIAEWFLAWGEQNNAFITNLKMQKLLYYAQGHYLGKHRAPLFDDPIEAWVHGPVVRSIYHAYKQYGDSPIDVEAEVSDEFSWDDFRDVEDDLIAVWNTYGAIEAWALRNRTHREAPWQNTFNHGDLGPKIPQSEMREFFAVA